MRRAYLGVGIEPVSSDLAKQFGVQTQHGVVVDEVKSNAPAAAAGLQSGDVILDFAGKPVNSPLDLQVAVEQSPIGTTQPLTVVRNGPAAYPAGSRARAAGQLRHHRPQ